MKRVSVIIPNRDRWSLTARAIESVTRQTLKPTEIIVVDDGSREQATPEVTRPREIPVKVTRYAPGVSAPHARNVGLENASGELVAFLDSDDRWRPDHLAGAVRLLEREGVVGVLGAYVALHEDGTREIYRARSQPGEGSPRLLAYMFAEGGLARTSTMVFDREVARAAGFDESLIKHEDWDFAIEAARHGRIVYRDEPTVFVDYAAPGRVSKPTNADSAFRLLKKYRSDMTPRIANGLLLRAARSAAIRDDGEAVRRFLAELTVPLKFGERLRATGLQLVAAVPGMGGFLAKAYLAGTRIFRKGGPRPDGAPRGR